MGITLDDREAQAAYDAAKASDNGVRVPLADLLADLDEPLTNDEVAKARGDLAHPAA